MKCVGLIITKPTPCGACGAMLPFDGLVHGYHPVTAEDIAEIKAKHALR